MIPATCHERSIDVSRTSRSELRRSLVYLGAPKEVADRLFPDGRPVAPSLERLRGLFTLGEVTVERHSRRPSRKKGGAGKPQKVKWRVFKKLKGRPS